MLSQVLKLNQSKNNVQALRQFILCISLCSIMVLTHTAWDRTFTVSLAIRKKEEKENIPDHLLWPSSLLSVLLYELICFSNQSWGGIHFYFSQTTYCWIGNSNTDFLETHTVTIDQSFSTLLNLWASKILEERETVK